MNNPALKPVVGEVYTDAQVEWMRRVVAEIDRNEGNMKRHVALAGRPEECILECKLRLEAVIAEHNARATIQEQEDLVDVA